LNTASKSKAAVLVTAADLPQEAEALLHEFEVIYTGGQPDEDGLVALCKRMQPAAILVRYGKLSARVLDACEALRVIAKFGVGIDNIDAKAAAARGIPVIATPGVNADSVAEHTWAFILSFAKSLPMLDARMHAGHWDKSTHKSMELKGRTLGLIGVGNTGSRVARIGIIIGMRVSGYDPYLSTFPPGVTSVSLDTLLRESDVVSLHCPLTSETRNIIDTNALASMRQGAILINAARGGLVDEPALVESLARGHVRAAGVDSFPVEPPPPDHPLRGVPGVMMTPHVAGVSREAYVNMGVAAARNILAVMNK
jgi:D-3-phosphoglycerate dehydrogenase / 2-oxoglutarate reductase